MSEFVSVIKRQQKGAPKRTPFNFRKFYGLTFGIVILLGGLLFLYQETHNPQQVILNQSGYAHIKHPYSTYPLLKDVVDNPKKYHGLATDPKTGYVYYAKNDLDQTLVRPKRDKKGKQVIDQKALQHKDKFKHYKSGI